MELLIVKERVRCPDMEKQFRLGINEQLETYWKGKWRSVLIKKCFPWAEEESMLSVMEKENELFLINDLNSFPQEQKILLRRFLLESQFIFQIIEVLDIEEIFELRKWSVKTESGLRIFETKVSHWPRY
ncbi:MAG: DUF1854 domain-containing protein, partial [Bdellovibrionales bacterium]|nr:DUF1854 domain-containing protein [Bdellovibrionales bacterium]